MKFQKVLIVFLSLLLFSVTGCNAPGKENNKNSDASTAAVSSLPSSFQESSLPSASAPSLSSEPASQVEKENSNVESKKAQQDSEWIAYDTNKDHYKLHIKKKDGTEDKVIVNDVVLAPCVAGEWVYYIAPLVEIDKVKLDGSQKTKVCSADEMRALNANVAVTAEYKDGYISYKLVQLREVGDSSPNTVTYYKLNTKTDKIKEVKG